jgi:hypothetical protein
MPKPLLYTVAGILSLLLILAGVAIVRSSDRLIMQRFAEGKQRLREQRDAGRHPAEWQGVDIDKADMQMKPSAADKQWFALSSILETFWYVLVPFVIVVCFGVAWLVAKCSAADSLANVKNGDRLWPKPET